MEIKTKGKGLRPGRRQVCCGIACGMGSDSNYINLFHPESHKYLFFNKIPYEYDEWGDLKESCMLGQFNIYYDNLEPNTLLC